MIDVNDLRKGVTFELDGNLWKVLDYHHHKPGRGNAVIRIKAVNLRSGTSIEKTFQSGDRVLLLGTRAQLEAARKGL